jgi:hypothetical protein
MRQEKKKKERNMTFMSQCIRVNNNMIICNALAYNDDIDMDWSNVLTNRNAASMHDS